MSAITRVEVVTEGVLTRMLLNDPALEGYAVVLFDEFHERSIHTDTALAFLRETVGALRPDLRIVVMSATLDAKALGGRLRTDAVVKVEAERHPVTISHRPPQPGEDLTDAAAAAVVDAVGSDAHAGDLLVFLPGVGAITRVERSVRRALGSRLDDELVVMPLHGSLRGNDQDAALRRDPRGRRKIVLATPLAETSVTIDGVATVIDTGQRRRPEIDHGRGMGVLRTVTASRAAADQRAGRAGRQQPGTCIRLWHAADDAHRPADEPPEITTADLSSLALDVAAWGATDIHELPWLDAPPAPALGQARALLADLELLDAKYR
ncbi:MAG: helicase-related protein, partial [Acidimicrobiales bacterium]|nr:helicase-related protein [Acidimicrobiales bacterium]